MKYIIEHMEPGFTPWVILEYSTIIQEVGKENLILTSLPEGTTEKDIPQELKELGLQWTTDECINVAESKESLCLLDPAATQELTPSDSTKFEYFVFGGILGDHPPRDRTGELRKKYGLEGRRLGALQMTTDTAVRTTQLIIQNQMKFEDITFIDYPEIRFNRYEATEMPFRYVMGKNGKPILPDGMVDLIKKDTEQSLDELM